MWPRRRRRQTPGEAVDSVELHMQLHRDLLAQARSSEGAFKRAFDLEFDQQRQDARDRVELNRQFYGGFTPLPSTVWDNQDMKTDSLNLTTENVLRADRVLRARLGHEPTVREVARFLEQEKVQDSLYVQVRFDGTSGLYTYKTSTPVPVGSYVVVPPPHLGQAPRMLKVARKGLPSHMQGSLIKPAHTVPPWVTDAQQARDMAQRPSYGESDLATEF
jgi:hypothetical protein